MDTGQRGGFCRDCRADMTLFPASHCSRCGRTYETRVRTNHICGACRIQPPSFDRAAAGALYEGALIRAITAFKYAGRLELTGPLTAMLGENLGSPFLPPETDLILPVPLHTRRLKERGFNQALILARSLFKPWKEKIRYDLLVRSRWTEPQVRLKGRERRRNVKGAFRVQDPAQVKRRRIMLVDDVFTTGSTVNECARVLKKAGADQVWVLTLARVR